MKTFSQLLSIVIFITVCGCNIQSRKKPAKYTDYDYGIYLFWEKVSDTDSAFKMFNSYVNNPDDTFKKGSAYRYMGEIQWNNGDFYGAQQSLTDAINTLDPLNEGHREELGIVYNLLGNVSLDLKIYDEALRLYDIAMNFAKGTSYIPEIMNGKAVVLQRMGKYNNAITVYDSILSQKPANQEFVARIIHNRARTKWLLDPSYTALPEYWTALKIRADSNYNKGLNASYAHLSDYYAKSKSDSALWYAQRLLEKATENQSPDDRLEAFDRLFRLNSTSDLKDHWYQEYKTLRDSFQFSRDTTLNRFALVKYDFQKSKADNLQLQQNVTNQRLLMYGLIALAVITITGIMIWYGKRKRRIQQESEANIRNARLKTSQKVHDVVANGLYGIMNELEHGKAIEREPLIDKIEGLYEKSRNISYEDVAAANDTDHDQQVYRLLTSFANEQTKVIIAGDQQTFWRKINAVQKQELQLVLNELMVNMKKHSRAKKVTILFKLEDNKALVTYQDDGVGFPPGLEHGNGLKHTVNRINSLHGDVNFGKSELGGASIAISFPLQSSQT